MVHGEVFYNKRSIDVPNWFIQSGADRNLPANPAPAKKPTAGEGIASLIIATASRDPGAGVMSMSSALRSRHVPLRIGRRRLRAIVSAMEPRRGEYFSWSLRL